MSPSKCFPRWMLVIAIVAAAVFGATTSAHAQIVRGTVVDQASGRALPATVVVLLDSAGKRVAGVLSGDDGRYAIRITVPGRYALRAERIGFRAEAPTPVSIAIGQTLELELTTRPIPVVLGEVKVTGRTACVVRASDGAEISAVWDEARKALFAMDITQQQELFSVKLTRFERMLDPQTGKVLSHQSRQADGVTRNPFVSVPAAELSAHGFVRQAASDLIYYGPDAAVLLSDEFLGDHCFRIRNGSGRRSAMLGLAFEPARGRDKPDIAGTLWLDRKTAELRDLEYVYTSLPNLPQGVRSDEFGGRIEFHRMPTGAWIVERWVIRMPVVADRGRFSRQDAIVPGAVPADQRAQLTAIKEEGGEVTESVARGSQRSLASDVGTVRGAVIDSTRMLGLKDARVFLDGTQFSTRSDVAGAFTIANVPPGTYTLSAAHPRFDSLHARAPSATVTVQAGDDAVANLTAPSFETLKTLGCTAYERANPGVMLRGQVIDGTTGTPAPDALVTVTWSRLVVATQSAGAVNERSAITRTDNAGRYTFCGLPEDVRLTARVAFDGRLSDPTPMIFPGTELAVKNLVVGTLTVVAAAERERTAVNAPRVVPAAQRSRAMQDFDRRRRRGTGTYLTRTQIDQSNASRLTDLLRRMPSVTLQPSDNGSIVVELRGSKKISFATPAVLADSGSSTARLPTQPAMEMSVKHCPAGFLIDGMAVDASGSIDLEMRPGLLEAIEVYTPAQVPIEYSGRYSECGVVMIWTRSYAERPDPQPGSDGER